MINSWARCHISAIKWLYVKNDMQMDVATVLSVKKVLGGFKRKIADLKQNGTIEVCLWMFLIYYVSSRCLKARDI